MVGCSGAQINLSVKSAIRASSQRLPGARHPGVAVQDLETWAKGCRGGQKAAYEVVAVLHPMEPGSTAGDLIVRYLGTQSELRQRIGALPLRILLVPSTTQHNGSLAMHTGSPVSSRIRLSKFFGKAPPPASTMPWSMMSAESSGGMRSSATLIPARIAHRAQRLIR
jgi:hypothetical protein